MRIGIDARKLHDFGIGTYIRNLVRHLSRLDHETEYVLFCRPADAASLAALGPNFRTVPETAGNYSVTEQWRFPLALKRERITLFHAPHYVLPPLVRCRSVVTIHDCIHLMFPQYLPNWVAHGYARASIEMAARRATRVLTVSESSKRDILRFVDADPAKIDVIYNAYDERFGLEPREEDVVRLRERYQLQDRFVLYAGNVKPHKNLERLIEAFHLVRRRGLRRPEAGDDRRRDLEVRRAAARRAPAPAPQVRAVSRLPAGGDAGHHVPAGRRSSCFPPSTKASACRRSRRWRAARPWSRRTCRRCPRWSATRRSSSIRTIPQAIADGMYRVLTDPALQARLCGDKGLRARAAVLLGGLGPAGPRNLPAWSGAWTTRR